MRKAKKPALTALGEERKRKEVAETRLLRGFDVIVAAVTLIGLAPLLLACSLTILLSDGRPILFRQKRVGRHGVLFDILKFRTMEIANAGPAITAAGDRRITPIGAWLRKYKLDELPQFFCVLRGHMSLIGPRPEVPEYVQPSDDLWEAVLQMRPGITDLASLAFRNEEDVLASVQDPEAHYRSYVLPEKLRLNIAYQKSRSLVSDLKLLWMTALYSFCPSGFDRNRVTRALGA